MAPYQTEGSLTTDKRTVDDTTTWDSQSEWEAYQSASGVEIVDGSVQLAELTVPVDVTNRWPMDAGSGSTLTDDIGSVPGALYGGWGVNGDAVGGYVTMFDTANNDYWVTDTSFGVNSEQMTAMTWVYWTDNSTGNARVLDTPGGDNPGGGSYLGEGWRVEFDGTSPAVSAHTDTGDVTSTVPCPGDEWVFLAVTFDGNTANMYSYDTAGQLGSASGSGSRTVSDRRLMGMVGDGNHLGGRMDAPAVSTTTAMSHADIEQYWNQTNR